MFCTFVDYDNPLYADKSHQAIEEIKKVAPKYS